MSRILHFADLHLDSSTRDNTEHALEQLIEAAQREQPDLIVNAGDLSMKRGLIAPWVSLALRRLHVELAKVAPTIVVSGNHDMGAAGDVGTVFGALELADAEAGRLYLIERPQIVRVAGLAVACLPYPSRHWLLANRPDISAKEVNAVLSDELRKVVQALGAEVADGERAILVYHGSIDGARTDTEQAMSTEIDVVLREGEIPTAFEAVLCGHIHKHQRIGRAVYAGSPCPLNFGEEKSEHGWVSWTLDENLNVPAWEPTFYPLQPKHPLVTLDWRDCLWSDECPIVDPLERGSRVRVLLRATSGSPDPDHVVKWFTEAGAHSVKVIIERPGEVRVNGPEVKAEAAMGALLDLYAERHPEITPETLEGLKALAEEVDGALPPEARLKQKVGGYRLRRLAWSNWKSYGAGNEINLDDLGRLIVIEGDNATGKSNAAEVEAFALYGKFVRGRQALAEAVRIGESEALIACEFEADGRLWKVERRIKVNGKGAGAQALDLFAMSSGDRTYEPAGGGSSRETQEKIESLVGPFDLYLATRFASQGDIDRLLDLSPAEMKDTLQSALATSVFDDRLQVGVALKNVAERTLQEHEASLSAWREIAGGLEAAELEAEQAEATLATQARTLEVCQEAQQAAEAALHAIDAEAKDIARLSHEWEEANSTARQAAQAVDVTEKAVKSYESLVASLGNIEGHLAALKEKRQQKIEEEALIVQSVEAQTAAERAKLELERQTMALSNLEEQSRRALDRHEDSNKDAIRRLAEKLDDCRKAAALLDRTPFGEKCVEAKCALVGNAVSARERISELEKEQAALPAAYEEKKAAILTEYQERATPLREEFDRLNAEAARLAADAEEKKHGRELLQRLTQEIAFLEAGKWEEKAREAASAQGRLDALRTELEGKRSEHQKAMERLESMGPRPDVARTAARLGEAQTVAGKAKADSAAAADSLAKAERAAGIAEGRLEECRKASARLAEAETAGANYRHRVELCRVYVQAVGRDGLPFLMLERALPALEAHANHFLCEDDPTGLRVEIGGLRDLQSGETRNEVTLRYRNGFGTHSVAAASGFERSVIGIALRAALSQVQAEASGVSVEHWIADECSGVCDESRLLEMQGVFRRISERFGRVFFISHQAEIKQIADTRLRVSVTADGSRIAA